MLRRRSRRNVDAVIMGAMCACSRRWDRTMGMLMLRSLLVWVALTFAWNTPARAGDLSPLLEMGVHLNVLSFDAGLKERVTGDTLTIAIVHATDHSAKIAAENFANAIAELVQKKNMTVHRKKLRVVLVPSGSDIASRLAGVNAVYVANGVPMDHVAAVASIGVRAKLPTLCSARENLAHGLAVAVIAKNNRPAIVVHLANAKQSGMLIDSKFMRLVEIVK